MWTRRELKERAKAAFKANYWRCVLVAFILALLIGGGAGSSVRKNETADLTTEQQKAMAILAEDENLGRLVEGMEKLSALPSSKIKISLGGLGLVGFLLSILVFNPLIVGCYRFFLQNSRGPAELNELGAGFRGDWGNVVLVMFLKNLFLALWTMLFIIPGIVKAYAYRMVPYILKEHPELSGTQAITLSRQMMKGHKGDAFVLDLSFLGWIILSALTFGILHLFYVGPYIQATDAELYKAVRADYEARLAAGTAA
jgi:uncharacterized membrane protein